MININPWTVVIHLALFLAMVMVLNQFLFKPLLAVMDQRKSRVEGNQAEAQTKGARSEELVKQYKGLVDEAKKEMTAEKESVRLQAQVEEDRIIKAARGKAGDKIAELREKIAVEFQEAEGRLRADSQALGREIAARILGRQV